MAEAGSIIINALVPGSGTVLAALSSIFQLCAHVHEAKSMCILFHGRLMTLQSAMVDLEKKNCLPSSDAIDKYTAILEATVMELAVYKDMRGLARLLNYRRLKKALGGLNENVNELFQMLQLATAGELMELKKQLQKQADEQLRQIKEEFAANSRAILAELRGERDEGDALLMMKYDVERPGAKQDDVLYHVIDNTLDALVRKSKASVDNVPEWFLIAADVSFNPKPIASGSFASVCVGIWRDGAKVAVKLFPNEQSNGLDTSTRKEFMEEATRWFKLNHANVIKMFGGCHVTSEPFIVCEYASKGNLMDHLAEKTNGVSNKTKMWKLLLEAAFGLEYLHSKGVIHGDLKLNNILVGDDGIARIADFGLSRVRASSSTRVTARNKNDDIIGGVHWLAPELFEEKTSKPSDVYAFAMCLVEAVSGRAPYGRLATIDIRTKIKTGVLPDRPEEMPDLAWKLVQEMTVMDTKKRMTLAAAIEQLKVLAQREKDERNASKEVCPGCRTVASAGSNFCSGCGTSFGSAPTSSTASGAIRLPPVSKLLQNFKTESKKTLALKQLYHQIVRGDGLHDVLDSEDGVQSLRDVLNESEDVVRVLYAYGCLLVLAASGKGLDKTELKSLREQANTKTANAKQTLEELLTPAEGATRDDQQALELLELFIQVDSNNRSVVKTLVAPVLRLLNDEAEEVRTGAVMALAAVAVGNTQNIEAIRDDKTALPPFAVSLAAVLTGKAPDTTKKSALDLLVDVTDSISAARACASHEVIEAVLAILRRPNDALHGGALRVVKNFAMTSSKKLIGSCGAVFVLVEALKLELSSDDRKLVLDALVALVDDQGNAAMFEQADGVSALASLLKQSTPKDRALLNLAGFVAQSEFLRKQVAAREDIIDTCVGSLKTGTDNEKQQAAYVLRELVKAGPVIVQTLHLTGGLVALEDITRVAESKTSREFASRALVYAIETLLKALEDARALPARNTVVLQETPSRTATSTVVGGNAANAY